MKEKQFEALRNKLLRGAADFYGKLEGLLKNQEDSTSRKALGNAYDELSKLTDMIGSHPEALAVQRRALVVRRELASRPSADAEAFLDVARSLLSLGNMQKQSGDNAEAMEAYEEARAIQRRLADADPANTRLQSELARSYNNIGTLLSITGEPAQALTAYEQARAFQRKLVEGNPAAIEIQGDLALPASTISAGCSLAWESRLPPHGSVREQALAIQQKLVEDNPSVIQFQSELASSYGDMGWLLLDARATAAKAAPSRRKRRWRSGENWRTKITAVSQFQSAARRQLLPCRQTVHDSREAD